MLKLKSAQAVGDLHQWVGEPKNPFFERMAAKRASIVENGGLRGMVSEGVIRICWMMEDAALNCAFCNLVEPFWFAQHSCYCGLLHNIALSWLL